MNHRYAYCSKDQDPDQDHEELPLTPGTGHNLLGRLTDEIPSTMEDTQTPHSFLSDSSLDGAAEGLKEEEEEEDNKAGVTDGQVEEARLSLPGAIKELGGSPMQESPSLENGLQNQNLKGTHMLSGALKYLALWHQTTKRYTERKKVIVT